MEYGVWSIEVGYMVSRIGISECIIARGIEMVHQSIVDPVNHWRCLAGRGANHGSAGDDNNLRFFS
jgi:hypothetical protein